MPVLHPRSARVVRRLLALGARLVVPLVLVAVSGGCRSKECVPGQQVACACPAGAQGTQVCDDEGARYSPCACDAPAAETAARGVEPPRPRPVLAKKQIRCGTNVCDTACCATFEPPSCTQDGRSCPRTANGEGVIFECDGPEDCGAEACCLIPGDRTIAAVCVPKGECAGTFTHPRLGTTVSPRVVCHVNQDCALSAVCSPAGAVAGISVCK
ncbi:hypothetical protein [Polyangium sp. 15x6]|uniref:hypothetical protein n=1 Tax=Polyangium sp. 15x6 TaxID=3042687 RepID=UPI00249CE55B|nr:hypothetical protein [Polyangium sp. 15x6]MDI3288284.1 hypothetical protein [Polyangium sp. 15x6]